MSSSLSNHSHSKTRSGFSSHLKWLLPLGCLAAVAVVIAFVALVLLIVFGSMRSSWAFEEGLRIASTHPDVIERLGEPITAGWFMSGSINIANETGNADLSIPLRGPKGRGTLYVVAYRSDGEWSMYRARVRLRDSDELLILLADDPGGDGPLPLEADDPS